MKGQGVFLAFLLIFAILLCKPTKTMGASSYCGRRCKGRCSKASVRDRCLLYCNICCSKCKCVPSGTYGNKQQCPCYASMKNSKGRPKCP